MPYIIKYLDKIAREKQRDVLALSFIDSTMDIDEFFNFDAKQCKPRMDVIAWLEANDIKWCPCALQSGLASSGHIYVDVPFDPNHPDYQKLVSHLENSDGSMKIKGVNFGYLPLEMAMEYACQDEPGYWDKYWDENGG